MKVSKMSTLLRSARVEPSCLRPRHKLVLLQVLTCASAKSLRKAATSGGTACFSSATVSSASSSLSSDPGCSFSTGRGGAAAFAVAARFLGGMVFDLAVDQEEVRLQIGLKIPNCHTHNLFAKVVFSSNSITRKHHDGHCGSPTMSQGTPACSAAATKANVLAISWK